jgi:hypothetical protein
LHRELVRAPKAFGAATPRLALSLNIADGPDCSDGEGGDLVAGNRAEDCWGVAEKFVEETEKAVGNEDGSDG